jgi:hypothetical protein
MEVISFVALAAGLIIGLGAVGACIGIGIMGSKSSAPVSRCGSPPPTRSWVRSPISRSNSGAGLAWAAAQVAVALGTP